MTRGNKWRRPQGRHEWGGWVIEDGAVMGDRIILLNQSETILISRFMEARGRVVTVAQLFAVLAPDRERRKALATIRTLMKNLRAKIGRQAIATVSRQGAYRLLPREGKKAPTTAIDTLIANLSGALSAARTLKKQMEW